MVTATGANMLPGDEIMTDASGFMAPYVNNGTNIPLGWTTFETFSAVPSQVPAVLYDP